MIRVAVNGYGVIGRRVADAIAKQSDMQLMGVVKVRPDYNAKLALDRGYHLYVPDERVLEDFRERGLRVSGTLPELLEKVDLVVDASPDGVGAENKRLYEAKGRGGIFQGGEDHDVAGFSFVAQCNYDAAKGRKYARVVSCNTTALCRVLHSIDQRLGIEKARVVLIRRAADPNEPSKGPIDAIVPDPLKVPSHHAPDVNTVLPKLKIVTMALKVPTTHMHLHSLMLTLKQDSSTSTLLEVLAKAPRILLIEGKDGLKSTAHLLDYSRELGRSRNDVYEVMVWRDSVRVDGKEACLFMAVHQEAIVVPENIDCIRALMGIAAKEESIKLTDSSLGIRSG